MAAIHSFLDNKTTEHHKSKLYHCHRDGKLKKTKEGKMLKITMSHSHEPLSICSKLDTLLLFTG